MAIHSCTLAWKIPWTEEPDRPQSMGLQRVRHNWATSLSLSYKDYLQRCWQDIGKPSMAPQGLVTAGNCHCPEGKGSDLYQRVRPVSGDPPQTGTGEIMDLHLPLLSPSYFLSMLSFGQAQPETVEPGNPLMLPIQVNPPGLRAGTNLRFAGKRRLRGEQQGKGAQEDCSVVRLAVSGFMLMGLVSGLSLANRSDPRSFLVTHASLRQDGFQRGGFWEVGRTYGQVSVSSLLLTFPEFFP